MPPPIDSLASSLRSAPATANVPSTPDAPRVFVLPAPGVGADVLGGKGANLSRLLEHGFAVPPAFVIAASIDGAELAGSLLDDVRRALATIAPGPFAVRSSATSEDGADASFAGMHETFLDTDGEEEVLEAIRACWRSGANERSAAYRAARGIARARMAVVVQRMIRPRAAGVLFTCDPVRRTRARILVEAVPGLGEALVSGHADPDRLVVDRATRAVVERHAADDRAAPCLDDAAALRLVETALLVERAFGGGTAQDIEWAVDDAGPWLLQARPVTTPLDEDDVDPVAARIVWTSTNPSGVDAVLPRSVRSRHGLRRDAEPRQRIRTGQLIRVDGTRGEVHLL